MRYLLVEDNDNLAQAISARFAADGHVVEHAELLSEARSFLATGGFDIILLDINLPDGLGTQFLSEIRRRADKTPVLVLTARPAIDDKIDALDLGADDYVVKPFDIEELVARTRAILRRSQAEGETCLEFGNILYSPAQSRAEIDGAPIELTKSETRLLELFLTHRGRVLEKNLLMDRLYNLDDEVTQNALELTISRLRKKITLANVEIKTLRGLGYQIVKSQK